MSAGDWAVAAIKHQGLMRWKVSIKFGREGSPPAPGVMERTFATRRRAERQAEAMVAYLQGEGEQPGFIFLG